MIKKRTAAFEIACSAFLDKDGVPIVDLPEFAEDDAALIAREDARFLGPN